MSSEDGANFQAEPSSPKRSAENARGGGVPYSIAAAGCGNSSPCDSPWDPWDLLQSQCNPSGTPEPPRNDNLVGDDHTFCRNVHQSSATNKNPPPIVNKSPGSANIGTRRSRDREKVPLLDPEAVVDDQLLSECSDLLGINLGPGKPSFVSLKLRNQSEKSSSFNLLPADGNDKGTFIKSSIRYPFEIFSEEKDSESASDESNCILSGNERPENCDRTNNCSLKSKVRDEFTKSEHTGSSVPCHFKTSVNKNSRIISQTNENSRNNSLPSEISENLNHPNSHRQGFKRSGPPLLKELDLPRKNAKVAYLSGNSQSKNPSYQSEKQLHNVKYNVSGLAGVDKTEGLSSSVENPRLNSNNHNIIPSKSQTNPFKVSSHQTNGPKAVPRATLRPETTLTSVNDETDRSQHYSVKSTNPANSTNNNHKPQSHDQEHDIASKRDAGGTLHQFSAVSQSTPTPPVSVEKCCQDNRRCSSSRPPPNTGTVVAVSSTENALHRNTSPTCSTVPLPGMAGQNHHHLNLTVLDDSAPRVPVHPPLDNSDVMGVPGRDVDDLLFQEQQRTSSLSTSFADLMLGDHTALRHKGRDGRLGRCGEGRDSTRLYGLNEAATIASLRETVLTLQLQNTQLSLCLQQERSRREQAESRVDQEKGYIKRLEDTIQTLKSTRLVIDPNMYRQIAESYIASRKTPVRRTCSSSHQRPGHYEDLVCDSSPDNSLTPSPTSPNSKSSQFLSSDATGPGGLSPTYTQSSSASTCANDTLGTLPPLPSTTMSRLPSQAQIFNERQDLRWPSERGDKGFPAENFLIRDNRSASSTRRDGTSKRRDV